MRTVFLTVSRPGARSRPATCPDVTSAVSQARGAGTRWVASRAAIAAPIATTASPSVTATLADARPRSLRGGLGVTGGRATSLAIEDDPGGRTTRLFMIAWTITKRASRGSLAFRPIWGSAPAKIAPQAAAPRGRSRISREPHVPIEPGLDDLSGTQVHEHRRPEDGEQDRGRRDEAERPAERREGRGCARSGRRGWRSPRAASSAGCAAGCRACGSRR